MSKISEVWPGRNRFCCGLITGPCSWNDCSANICVYICLLICVIPTSVLVLPRVWEITPVLPITMAAFVILLVTFLLLTSYSDPGIIPRRPFLESNPVKYDKYLTLVIP